MLTSATKPVTSSIQCALHKFTSLYGEVLAFLFHVSQAGVKVAAHGEQVRQLVHFELHLRDLEANLLQGVEGFFGRN